MTSRELYLNPRTRIKVKLSGGLRQSSRGLVVELTLALEYEARETAEVFVENREAGPIARLEVS